MVSASTVRQMVARHGPTRPQAASKWSGTFRLPGALEKYYRDVGPFDIEIPGYGNGYYLPSLEHLWDLQEGYRWHGKTKERLADWADDWLVVAHEGSDAFIFDRATDRIMRVTHGTGSWEPDDIFADVYAMAGVLATLGSVVESAGLSLTDDDSYVRPEHRATAIRNVGLLLGTPDKAEEALALLGWG